MSTRRRASQRILVYACNLKLQMQITASNDHLLTHQCETTNVTNFLRPTLYPMVGQSRKWRLQHKAAINRKGTAYLNIVNARNQINTPPTSYVSVSSQPSWKTTNPRRDSQSIVRCSIMCLTLKIIETQCFFYLLITFFTAWRYCSAT